MRMQYIILVLVLFISQWSLTQTTSSRFSAGFASEVLEFSKKEIDSVLVRGQNLEIKLQDSVDDKLHLSGTSQTAQWSVSVSENRVLIIEQLDRGISRKKVLIQVPSVGVEIRSQQVDLTAENLKKDIKVVSVQGNLWFSKCKNELELQLHSGDIQIDNQMGKMDVEGYQIKTSIKNSQAETSIRAGWLTATFDKNVGHHNVKAYQATVNLNQNSGSFLIDLVKGRMVSIETQGRIEANVEEVNSEIRIAKDADLNIKSKSGRVFVNSNKVSGVWLNLSSKESDIFLPGNLRAQKLKNENLFRGRTPGERTQTRMEIKTLGAPIIIK